jgi:bifunctional DNA-binding transcriptional regulator/antitoxin component of YhaV-PrlF toxin-antitoxin module
MFDQMEESVVKRVDPQGRVSIPAEWRRGWKSDRVVLRKLGDRIEVTPIEPISPSSLFDSIEIGGDVDFTDPHSLRKALLEPRGR